MYLFFILVTEMLVNVLNLKGDDDDMDLEDEENVEEPGMYVTHLYPSPSVHVCVISRVLFLCPSPSLPKYMCIV